MKESMRGTLSFCPVPAQRSRACDNLSGGERACYRCPDTFSLDPSASPGLLGNVQTIPGPLPFPTPTSTTTKAKTSAAVRNLAKHLTSEQRKDLSDGFGLTPEAALETFFLDAAEAAEQARNARLARAS